MIDTYRRILSLLNRSERRRFSALLAMILIMGFVEAVGVASIMPFIAVLADPSVIQSNESLAILYGMFGFTSTNNFLIFLGLCLVVIVVFGLVFKAVTVFALTRFSYMRSYTIGSRLLWGYLSQPYQWFLHQHSADLSKTVLSEVEKVVNGAIVPAMKVLAQFAVVLFLVVFVVVVDPVVALVAGAVLGTSYVSIYVCARRYLAMIGKDRVRANQERYRIGQEVLGGIKDVKIRGTEAEYHRRFRDSSFRFARHEATNQIIAALPRFLLEAVAFGGMLGLILFLLQKSESGLSGVLPLIALYAFAGLRLLPAMQQFYAGVTQLRYSRPALVDLSDRYLTTGVFSDAWKTPQSVCRERLRVHEYLELSNVSFSYPHVPRMALEGLSMRIRARTTVALVGGSGAGKTTAADIILGLLWPDQGSVVVDGADIGKQNVHAWQNSIGYVPQQIFLIDDTIAANIAFGVPSGDRDYMAIERASRIAELHEFVVQQLPDGYDTVIGERGVRLSGGQRQRIGVARALYHDPDVLILDEATSALDNLTERAVMDAVHNLGRRKTIVLIAHRLSTVQACDQIFVLQDGAVIDNGTYQELLDRCPLFQCMAAPGASGDVILSAH